MDLFLTLSTKHHHCTFLFGKMEIARKSLEIHSETDSSLNPQTLMSVHKIRMIATVMQCVETLLEVIPASAMLDSREMEGSAPVGCVTSCR